jgi:hypothetical protein
MRNFIFSFFIFFLPSLGFSQNCVVDPANNLLPENDNVDFVFDTFREYQGGIEQYGSTILKVKVDNTVGPPLCKWKLYVVLTNNLWPITTDWNPRATYGSGAGGGNPALDLLQLRVTNTCNTPDPLWALNPWTSFGTFPASATSGDILYIINDPVLNNTAPCDGTQVNSAGSYLTDYGEYTFKIDYRINPGFGLIPGFYDLNLTFYIAE